MNNFLTQLKEQPNSISFDMTMALIDQFYNFTPTEFVNGELVNKAGENNGSCKLFAFAKLQSLTEEQTLHCFGDYYRQDVLANSQGQDHQNIRNFIKTGWSAIIFKEQPLILK